MSESEIPKNNKPWWAAICLGIVAILHSSRHGGLNLIPDRPQDIWRLFWVIETLAFLVFLPLIVVIVLAVIDKYRRK